MSRPTATQEQAIAARGNVLVMAGAGTGKTRTLVERCLDCLIAERPPVSLDEILIVTFTEAAASEIRQRIRSRLEEELSRHADDLRWHEQLALFELANIGTLHSFCFRLVRQHFHELNLDPQLNVLPEEESRLLAVETLDRILQNHYAGESEASEAVRQLIQSRGRGSDKAIRSLVFKLHDYAQTLPDPDAWFHLRLTGFEDANPGQWEAWLLDAVRDWRDEWLEPLRLVVVPHLTECIAALDALPAACSRTEAAAVLEQVCQAYGSRPRGKKTPWPKSLEGFFDEANFLGSLARTDGERDPLAEDWNWVRSKMATLLRLTDEFRQAFSSVKREQGALDFHDLEQYALRLLWDRSLNQPTRIARHWRKQLRFIFVDEYQDINAAQDKIMEALSRDGADANRFLVGDVKQSIYRFRLANPRIFQQYAEKWRGELGATLALRENFRSREALLDFVNSLFGFLMQGGGSVAYDEQAQLRFGAPEKRGHLGRQADSGPRVELHFRWKPGKQNDTVNPPSGASGALLELEDSEKEARMVALRLRELAGGAHRIWDETAAQFRPVEWADIAVLLRSPANKAEAYAKEFSRLGVPLLVARGSFYESIEIADLLNLLQLIDNPLQDLPLLAVLRSPVVGMSLGELAAIRAVAPKINFWTALRRWHEQNSEVGKVATGNAESSSRAETVTSEKVGAFLNRYARWRRLARQMSLSHCVDTVLQETHYLEWLLTQPRGPQRAANVQRLIELIRQYDRFQRQGLFRFLRFVEAQKASEMEPDVPAASEVNAVRLMSIHQSKGLEFPVVVVADLGKAFNLSDLQADIILDEEYGLCPQVRPPHAGRSYPSLPYWMARKRQRKETLSEELRLLYVATTRARDTLILTGSISEKKFESEWTESGRSYLPLLSARSYADWITAWFSSHGFSRHAARNGETPLLRWRIQGDESLQLQHDEEAPSRAPSPTGDANEENWEALRRRLEWNYLFPDATVTPAKASVSALRRRAGEQFEAEAENLLPRELLRRNPPGRGSSAKSASDRGTAHHRFLQFVSLEHADDSEHLRVEADRLARERLLSPEEIELLDFESLAALWKSELGCKIRAHWQLVQREVAFTARFAVKELADLIGEQPSQSSDEEFVVVQGAADLVVRLPGEIWLVDFKTDRMDDAGLAEKFRLYAPQLKLYARALSRICSQPVTECHLHFLSVGKTVPVPAAEVMCR